MNKDKSKYDYEEWSRDLQFTLNNIGIIVTQSSLLFKELDPLMAEYKDLPKDTCSWTLNGKEYILPVGTTPEIDQYIININYLLSNLLK
jgi:hypothetical protein